MSVNLNNPYNVPNINVSIYFLCSFVNLNNPYDVPNTNVSIYFLCSFMSVNLNNP